MVGVVKTMKLSRLPREARRTRKPLQENWLKGPKKTFWIQCMYQKCNYYWRYSGGKNWAECPICHSISKVSIARKCFKYNNPET